MTEHKFRCVQNYLTFHIDLDLQHRCSGVCPHPQDGTDAQMNAENIAIGDQIWVPCEVKVGPFSDEKMIRVTIDGEEWVGFVRSDLIRTDHGLFFVSAVVLDVQPSIVLARMPGNSPAGNVVRAPRSQVTSGSIEGR